MDQAMEIPPKNRSLPVLTTSRLLLREFSLDDVPTVFEMLRRKDINGWLPNTRLPRYRTRQWNRGPLEPVLGGST
jgi:RimJ/RimL family protein N-acetyltransferase